MSVSTPILTTSSETCASAAVDASSAAARTPSLDRFPANILSPPCNRRVGRVLQAVAPPIGLICNCFGPASTWPKGGGRAVPGSVYFRLDSGHSASHDLDRSACRPRSRRSMRRSIACCEGVEPVAPVELPLAEALRCIAAEMPPLEAHPPHDVAAVDGCAFARPRSGRRVLLFAAAVDGSAGLGRSRRCHAAMACDCVLDADSVDLSGPMPQVLAEAIPGQGVRRAGGDIAAGSRVVGGRTARAAARSPAGARGWNRAIAASAGRGCASSISRGGSVDRGSDRRERATRRRRNRLRRLPRAATPHRSRRHSMAARAICS